MYIHTAIDLKYHASALVLFLEPRSNPKINVVKYEICSTGLSSKKKQRTNHETIKMLKFERLFIETSTTGWKKAKLMAHRFQRPL